MQDRPSWPRPLTLIAWGGHELLASGNSRARRALNNDRRLPSSVYADDVTAADNLLPVKDAGSFLREFAAARSGHGLAACRRLTMRDIPGGLPMASWYWAEWTIFALGGIPVAGPIRRLNYRPDIPCVDGHRCGRVVMFVEGSEIDALNRHDCRTPATRVLRPWLTTCSCDPWRH